MSKTSTDLARHALNGATMGTRWSAQFFSGPGIDAEPVRAALQQAVDEVDRQMSLWIADSDLMRVNRAPAGTWLELPQHLAKVLRLALDIGRASGGAFDIGVGDAVSAWGFGPEKASGEGIRAAEGAERRPAWESLELDGRLLRKHRAITLDLNGIAKGYGVDRLAETLGGFGINSFLVSIDGELRSGGLRPDGEAWTIAIEAPDRQRRAVHSVLGLLDAAVATSGDYRHFVEAQGHYLSHTMDPRRGAPISGGPASVTVVAPNCAEADAWATALMVLGPDNGRALAECYHLEALMLMRGKDGEVAARPMGTLFGGSPGPAA